MKKNKKNISKKSEITPEQALNFLEDFRQISAGVDESTKLISIRVPENILRLLKVRAKSEGKKYQSLMIEYIRSGLKNSA